MHCVTLNSHASHFYFCVKEQYFSPQWQSEIFIPTDSFSNQRCLSCVFSGVIATRYVSRINGNDGITNTSIIQEAANRGEVCKYLELVIRSSQSLQIGACDEHYSTMASDWRAWLELDASVRWWIGGGECQHLWGTEKKLKSKETGSILNVWVVKECGVTWLDEKILNWWRFPWAWFPQNNLLHPCCALFDLSGEDLFWLSSAVSVWIASLTQLRRGERTFF